MEGIQVQTLPVVFAPFFGCSPSTHHSSHGNIHWLQRVVLTTDSFYQFCPGSICGDPGPIGGTQICPDTDCGSAVACMATNVPIDGDPKLNKTH